MLHSIRPVAIPVLNAEWEWRRGSLETVECSNHFGHTQQFLSNAKLTLDESDESSDPHSTPFCLKGLLFDAVQT